MNNKSKTEKTAFGTSKEEFQQMSEEQERSKTFEDKALEQFVKKPKESNLSKLDKIISGVNFILIFFLLCVMFTVSVVGTEKNGPIAILSMICILLLLKEAKRNDEENSKKYK